MEERQVISQLNANWVWVPNWVDSSSENTAGKIVYFDRSFNLSSPVTHAILYCSADTRYKLFVNRKRVAVGPARGSPLIWYYDSLDISRYLRPGKNEVTIAVLRYFASTRAAMPFERTSFPGLTVCGTVETSIQSVDLSSAKGWLAHANDWTSFPTNVMDDGFLHISERVIVNPFKSEMHTPRMYSMKTLNGDLLPWRLRPRPIPMPEESRVAFDIQPCQSTLSQGDWSGFASQGKPILLPAWSSHIIEIQAKVHSTAFLRWLFQASAETEVLLKVTYSEGYELEPRSYPFFRSKSDRLDAQNGRIIGPSDMATLRVPKGQHLGYEPFWFRTFRVMRVEITTRFAPVKLLSLEATQVNYPLAVKASWKESGDTYREKMWEVSIRTLRNCMFDGYSDCPFYEQLQYSGDTRTVALFHYLLSGDDRLMRQAITAFAASTTYEGLTQSRFPSHVSQLIAGFSLYWILQVCDHYLYFGDVRFARSFLPRIDGVLEFFNSYVDEKGLVSGLPEDLWQFVDWVTTWGATDEFPDKGVPTSGRKSNLHTYFSMLYAYVLKQTATLLRQIGRPAHSSEYEERATSLIEAVRKNCYDGHFFTDSTADIADELAYSQHCQVFAVLCGAVLPYDSTRLLTEAFASSRFSKCSYMMKFYALRAFAMAGDKAYESYWSEVWEPYHKMLNNNLTTWEEDDVRQRSDCHAWGSVPIYEFCTELAGVRPIAPGCTKIVFRPRLSLSQQIEAKVALGKDNSARVSWRPDDEGRTKHVELELEKAIDVASELPGGPRVEHGVIRSLGFVYPL